MCIYRESDDGVLIGAKDTTNSSDEDGYSYQWWTLAQHGIFNAAGLYGQKIYVIPEYDMVVVFTAGIMDAPNPEKELLLDYILPAVDNYMTEVSPADSPAVIAMVIGVPAISVLLVAVVIIKKR